MPNKKPQPPQTVNNRAFIDEEEAELVQAIAALEAEQAAQQKTYNKQVKELAEAFEDKPTPLQRIKKFFR